MYLVSCVIPSNSMLSDPLLILLIPSLYTHCSQMLDAVGRWMDGGMLLEVLRVGTF